MSGEGNHVFYYEGVSFWDASLNRHITHGDLTDLDKVVLRTIAVIRLNNERAVIPNTTALSDFMIREISARQAAKAAILKAKGS